MALWYNDQVLSCRNWCAGVVPWRCGTAIQVQSDTDRQMLDADGQPPNERPTPSYEFRLETVKLLLELDDTINTAYDVSYFTTPFRLTERLIDKLMI